MWFYWLPIGLQFFWKVLSFYTHYTFIGTTFINRCQPVPVRFSGPELVAPHLESALDEPPMEMKYIDEIYNFWKRKYIWASFKYTSSIFQIYVRYILANIWVISPIIDERLYLTVFDLATTARVFTIP